MKVDGIFSMLNTTRTGLNNQLKRLEVISENIANANTYPDENGKVYQRKLVQDKIGGQRSRRGFANEMTLSMKRSRPNHIAPGGTDSNGVISGKNPAGPKVVEVSGEQLVFEPGHPQANEAGYVRVSDVNVVSEMVDMVSASRAYEANVNVMNAAKQIAKKTMEI